MIIYLFQEGNLKGNYLPNELQPKSRSIVTCRARTRFFISYSRMGYLPSNMISFQSTCHFFVVSRLTIVSGRGTNLFQCFIGRTMSNVFFFKWIGRTNRGVVTSLYTWRTYQGRGRPGTRARGTGGLGR